MGAGVSREGPGGGMVCELSREILAGDAGGLESCWAVTVVKTLPGDGHKGEVSGELGRLESSCWEVLDFLGRSGGRGPRGRVGRAGGSESPPTGSKPAHWALGH